MRKLKEYVATRDYNESQHKYITNNEFYDGLKKGMPIALGYVPVSFTFGLMAVTGGLPIWLTIFISLSNLTSAGQFAGTGLIIAGASYLEIGVTTFVINIRYMLMSLALSQKIKKPMSIFKRCLISFGITDETFTLAAMEKGNISFLYMLGLITGPFLGWGLGTALGAMSCSVLSESVQNSMGIALYAMFIALIVPESKKSKPALMVVAIAVTVNCILTWIPIFVNISSGWRIIIATIIASSIGALLFPKEED
ncbi:autotransporter [Vallitalea longa]|uniref:Autotransporter n=1 Tax=Vallitalea longa TaxID=2936439 RepID=A0A9W6DFU4_9FIRM|nr:autotransporter [Vallitalea longa]